MSNLGQAMQDSVKSATQTLRNAVQSQTLTGTSMEFAATSKYKESLTRYDWYKIYDDDPRETNRVDLEIGGQIEVKTFSVAPTEHDRKLGEVKIVDLMNGGYAACADYDLPECDVGDCRYDGKHKFKGNKLCDDHLQSAHQTM